MFASGVKRKSLTHAAMSAFHTKRTLRDAAAHFHSRSEADIFFGVPIMCYIKDGALVAASYGTAPALSFLKGHELMSDLV